MADVKISALPAATTPLAGTEVLPIVQSATTKQVAVADLTAGRAMSASSLTLTTPLSAANGGTGLSSLGTGVATALGVNTGTAGAFVVNGGALGTPSSGTLTNCTGIPAAGVTGTLPVANGGTGLTSLTAGYIPYGNGTGAFSSGSALQFDGNNLGVGVTPIANTRIYTRTAASTDTAYYADNGVNTGFQVKFGNTITNIGNDFSAPIAFFTNGYANERMRIASDGSVGIGTTSPAYTLDVSGATRLGAGSSAIIATVGGAFAVGQGELYTVSTNSFGLGTSGSAPINFYTNSTLSAKLDASGNLGLGVSSFGTSAAKVIGMANATAPTTSPAGMGQLYVESGALKYRGSSGTVTTIAAA